MSDPLFVCLAQSHTQTQRKDLFTSPFDFRMLFSIRNSRRIAFDLCKITDVVLGRNHPEIDKLMFLLKF